DPGHAKSFQFAAQKEALYKITFTDSPSTRELLFASNGDSTAEQAQILVGANVYNIDNIGADSTVYVHADQGDVVYVIYYGQKKSAEIEPLTEEDNKITLSVAESEPILYGDDFYAFNNWKFTAGSDTYGIEDNICGRGSITVTTEGEYAGEKLGETRVSFSLAMDPSIKLDAVAKVVHVDELADSLNLPDITLGMELSFSNVDANYDGNPATVLNISEEGFYEYQIKRKGTGDAGIWMYAEDGSYMEYTRDSDAISLKAGSYIFIDREDAVESLKIVKVDKAELESLYDENKDKTQSDYTPESWAVFSAALKRAEDALAGRLTQEEINEIKEELSKAAAGLEEISVQPTPTPTPSPTPTPTEPVNPPVTYYTIRFDSQGGSAVSSQSLTYGSKVREPQAPTRDGYTLAGWYKESSCTNPWDFAKDTVTSSHTLYAKWEEISQTPEVPAVSEIISRKGYLEVKLGAAITGADGYEYAYSTAGGDWTTAEDYTVLGETKELSYTSTKVPAGIYVVRVRAYKESAEGKRYGAWSEEQWTELPTGTLDAPEILSVKVQGRTVTVKVKGPDGAEGYDAVMGVNGNPIKPTPYSYVIKNQKTTTLVFENVADGIYYIGVHAYSKENGVKTFSKWSAQKQAEVAAGDLPETEAPDTPTIIGHYAKKGYLKVRIAEGAEGERGYEYAYSTKGGAWTSPEDYTLFGRTPLLYRATTKIPAGVYAVKVRAFIRVNGERIYSSWSQPEWVELPTGTLKAPKIKNAKVNGNTVTLTLTGVKGAAGYDAVLGRSHNPAKPTSYAYVKKNQRTVTITFRNVKAGTYYIGAHAYAKEAGKKVFSKWSGQKKIVVK
ncbi:MAG TPA: InlB B-repeat-containing protein, partial [Candidatus Blautia faecigallinarum]|nr:InlB B-repeat-containing protein [Candidatus Blautia faecigallinarum]